MTAYEDLKNKSRTTNLDCAVIYYGEDPYDNSEVEDAEKAATELAELRSVREAVRKTVKFLQSVQNHSDDNFGLFARMELHKLEAVLGEKNEC